MKWLGWTTDLTVLRLGGSVIDDRRDHFLISTPANPGYHWGNCVYALDDPDDAERWVAVFAEAFPDAAHRAIALAQHPTDATGWGALGLTLETDDVLASFDAPEPTEPSAGYTVQRLGTPEHWAASTAMRHQDDPVEQEFQERSTLNRADMSAAGHTAWFGAFAAEGDLVAELGIVDCGDGVARYQSVMTAPDHRRRGLAGHLLGVAGEWAREHFGAERWVIIAEPDSDAARLYRRHGFSAFGHDSETSGSHALTRASRTPSTAG